MTTMLTLSVRLLRSGGAQSLDVDAAIEVCRKAGYPELALRLAEADGNPLLRRM